MRKYDVAIIGAGPGGITAAIYATRSGLSTVIIERDVIGGQASLTYEVNNYPGFVSISGSDLTTKMHDQATLLGADTVYGEVTKIDFLPMNNLIFVEGEEIFANTIILDMGAKARTLGAEGEIEYLGRGICYSAVCDGAEYKGKDVVLIGGGDGAINDAIYLSNICKSVTIINNLPNFTCSEKLLKQLEKQITEKNNVKVNHNSKILEFVGDGEVLKAIKYLNDDNTEVVTPSDGVFISIGRAPDTKLVRTSIHLDEQGYIAVNENFETNIPGVFACGDIIVKKVRQIITACADGAVAATCAREYINQNK